MDFTKIIEAFEIQGAFPFEAVEAARADRAALTPRFVETIEKYAAGDPDARAHPDAVFMILHLLAEWKAPSAFGPLIQLLRLPNEPLGACLGDSLTETVHRVMASVYDGNPIPLQQLILDPEADKFVRSGMFETLAILVRQGALAQEHCGAFLEHCFAELEPQGPCFAWHGWADAIAALQLSALKPLVKIAYDREYIDITWGEYDDFLADFDRYAQSDGSDKRLLPFQDIEDIAGWHCFSEAYAREREDAYDDEYLLEDFPDVSQPAINPFRGIGRNDPCPCGSGKKFKKCCLLLSDE